MQPRLDLQVELEALLGSENVYFQPPETVKLIYPCIVYSRDSFKTMFADDKPYNIEAKYSITVIDPNPDTEIPVKVLNLPMCTFSRYFTINNLNHYVFKLIY